MEGENFMTGEKMVVINKFNCCGKRMVTVIIKDRAACVMAESEYNRIIETERKYLQKNTDIAV